jgi:hypothetical protein
LLMTGDVLSVQAFLTKVSVDHIMYWMTRVISVFVLVFICIHVVTYSNNGLVLIYTTTNLYVYTTNMKDEFVGDWFFRTLLMK